MVSLNGRLLPSELATVEGLPLGKGTANAYLRMKAAAKAAGIDIWIAQPIGGYRSYAVQADMKVHPALYGLSTVSTVTIASAGYSTHGLGNALDIGSFGSAYGTAGAKRSAWLIQHAPEFGFFREFGDRDPNHFHHDGFTAVDSIIDPASTGAHPPIMEDFMATLSDAEKDDLFNSLHDLVKGLAVANARKWTDDEAAQMGVLPHAKAAVTGIANLSGQLAAVGKQVGGVDEAVWATGIQRTGPDGKIYTVSVLQDLANTGTNVGGLADTITARVVAQLPAGSDADPAAIAAVIRAELARVFVAAAG